MEDMETLKDFIGDCEIVVHGGTPFQLDVKDPQKELFDPTIKGTENFLNAIQESSLIEKVVFIASVGAWNTNFPLPAGLKTSTAVFDETNTKFTSPKSHPYAQAKFIANQMVEKFIKENPKLSFEISSVSPVMVMGKSLSTREDSTATGMQFLFKHKIAPNSFIQMFYDEDVPLAIVDVTDVAEAIFRTATKKGLHGKNYLLSSQTYPVSDVSLMLNNQTPKNNASIIYKNELAQKDLGMKFRPVRETLNNYSK